MKQRHPGARATDGVLLAVLTSRFDGIVRSMVNTLVRTGRSGVLNTARDFSCCIVTDRDELLAIAESVPIHVLGAGLLTKSMADLHPEFRRGDAFLHNSPYHGNTHAGDHSIIVPVVDDEDVYRFAIVVKAHQADCGNSLPTTYAAEAVDVYEEGALLFPCVRVQEAYADCPDILRMCELRIRVPDQWRGDYLALLGAARIGERHVLALGEEVGWDALDEYRDAWFAYSERLMGEAISRLPEGEVEVETRHDPFPGVPAGIPVHVKLSIRPREERIVVDLRANEDCVPCGLNLSEATATAAGMVGVFNSIDEAIPVNAGSFRRIDVYLRENCVVGKLRHPASGSVATTNVADRVINAVQRGMAEFGEGVGLAEIGLSQPPALAVISGNDHRRGGAPFVNQLILPALTGGPGSPRFDGWLTLGNGASAGIMYRDSVEIDEIHHPIYIHDQRIIPDTEGAGRFRGAPAAYVEYGPAGSPIDAIYVSDGSYFPAEGVRGGTCGARASQHKRLSDGRIVELPACGRVRLEPGETIISMSCGGGGYGPPQERAPELVQRDVREGWVSLDRARDTYLVAIDADGEIDYAETQRLRDVTTRVRVESHGVTDMNARESER